LALATTLLAPQGWTAADVDAAIATGHTRQVPLDTSVPVHVLYWTAWADEDGTLHFRDDVYERDGAVRRALSSPPPR
jgi:murein L,D-transpeptidase YcbB/YkuD